jgi:hypothetical protein
MTSRVSDPILFDQRLLDPKIRAALKVMQARAKRQEHEAQQRREQQVTLTQAYEEVKAELGISLHPKQLMALTSEATELLFGGAAGPGKSLFLRMAAIIWCHAIPGLQVYMFRRTHPELYENHMEGPKGFPALLAPWLARKYAKINYARSDIDIGKSRILLGHCQHEKNVYAYQGAEIHLLLIDELTHFLESQYRYLRSRVRMIGVRIADAFRGVFPRIIAASNPGNIGHNFVRRMFISPVPAMDIWEAPAKEGGFRRQFIPGYMEDNPSLLEDDPGYEHRLEGLGDPTLVKAMRYGIWDIVAGGMLDDLWQQDVHVITPFEIPSSWQVYRAFDWGSSRPFSVGWWAKSDGTTAPNGRTYPRGTLFRIDEWYGAVPDRSNEGLRMLAVDVAKGIMEREARMKHVVKPGPADSSIFDEENGNCIATDMSRAKLETDDGRRCTFHRADKSPGSRHTGWEAFRKMLAASTKHPMEEPGLFVFNTCRDFIRLVPTLPRDPRDPEDVDTASEDHIGDESRYMITWTPPVIDQRQLMGL